MIKEWKKARRAKFLRWFLSGALIRTPFLRKRRGEEDCEGLARGWLDNEVNTCNLEHLIN
jgi:hypothetical protein